MMGPEQQQHSLQGIIYRLGEFNTRLVQGPSGSLAAKDRSLEIKDSSDQLLSGIKKEQRKWRKIIVENKPGATEEKDKKLEELRHQWHEVKKGGKEEEKWLQEALGITAAFFEDFVGETTPGFEFWDNQLLYMSLMTADEGKYSFGELTSNNRAVQLDTGEGKTKSSAIIAAVKTLQDKPVVIVEQNYISAETHAKETAPFFEKFLNTETGLLTDKAEERKIITYPGLKKISFKTQDRQAYIFQDGKLEPQKGTKGRREAWHKKIVYSDFNSLGIDAVTDRQITTRPEEKMQPDLKNRVALVQEADRLMVDEAINPFEIQSDTQGEKAWKIISEYLPVGEKELLSPSETISYIYSLWSTLETMVNKPSVLRELRDENSFLVTGTDHVVMGERLVPKIEKQIAPFISGVFDGDKEKTRKFMKKNRHITEAALETMLGQKPYQGYLPDHEPVLMDHYGVPLDNRQLSTIHHVFLQLSNIWEQEGMAGKELTAELLTDLISRTSSKIKIPEQILNRILPSVLFREFGELRATSGSLLPVTKTMSDIYEAETLTVGRHKPIESQSSAGNKLEVGCLDGGMAEVDFVENEQREQSIYKYIKEIRDKKQAGLIIMPDIIVADELYQFIIKQDGLEGIKEKLQILSGENKGRIRIITGREEYKSRGALEKTVADLGEGDIIITTQVAHRDIDPRLSRWVIENGGLTSIVYSPPNERGLWQALQRSIRANIPGRRLLIIDEETLLLTKNRHLLDSNQLSRIRNKGEKQQDREIEKRVKEFTDLWEKSLTQDRKAQIELFDRYLKFLRYEENQTTESILFGTVQDRFLDQLKYMLRQHLNKKEVQPHWQSYINSVAKGQNIKQVEEFLFSILWSEALEANDYLYRSFDLSLTPPRPQNIKQYENLWRIYQADFVNNFNIKKYVETKNKID